MKKLKDKIFSVVLILCTGFVFNVRADTYSTFKTTRYYSANRRFFVVVNENKRAALYRNGRKLHKIWRGTLAYLPSQLLITDNGNRVVIVDRYYGNNGAGSLPVVIFLDEKGKPVASHKLGDVANLKRVLFTTSTAHWLKEFRLLSKGEILLIETIISKYDNNLCKQVISAEEAEKCSESIPFEELHFALATGELVKRKRLVSE
ncbi:MAG TPA: hypothetical protein VGB02_09700 [Pyrinomonadaceae bacterium]